MTTVVADIPEVPPGAHRLTVCVFCGARPGVNPEAVRLAREVGAELGLRGHELLYGSGGAGLMGEVARSATSAGARVTGVVPRFLYELEVADQADVDEMILTEDMFDRKREMIRRSDAFIALPGGYGTLDEILEVASLAYLGQCPKPLVLIDIDGMWEPLRELVVGIGERGFTRSGAQVPFHVVRSAAEAVDFLEQRARAVAGVAPVGA